MGRDKTSREFDPQEIDNKEHDDTLDVKKVLFYGWTGTEKVALKITDGKVVVSVL